MTEFAILPSGFRNIAEGRDFYDKMAEGLGDYFIASIFAKIESLGLYAGIHRKVWGYHRMLVEKFRYAMFYKITEEKAVLFRILDCRRNPKTIRQSIKKYWRIGSHTS